MKTNFATARAFLIEKGSKIAFSKAPDIFRIHEIEERKLFVYDTDCDDNFYPLDSDSYRFIYAVDTEGELDIPFSEVYSDSTREFAYGKNGLVRVSYSEAEVIVHVIDGLGVEDFYLFAVEETINNYYE